MRLAYAARAGVAGAVRWLSARPRLATAAFVFLSSFLVLWTHYYAGHADRWVDRDVYTRVGYWIASSECTVRTGVVLGHCLPDGKVEGIENASIADDRGHTIVANLYALLAGEAITLRGLVIANIVINAVALFTIALTLFLHGWKVSALFLLMAPRYVVPGPLPSPDGSASYISAFLFALVAAVLIAHVPLRRQESARVHWLVVTALAAACLGWSTLLRQPYGYSGFLVILLVLGLRWLWECRNDRSLGEGMVLRTGAVVAALALATFYGTSALFTLRGVVYDLPRSDSAIESHGISHNLYLGLGVPGNPWGIKWDDGAALAHIGEADRIQYGSNDHYRSLRNSYVRIVAAEPLKVAAIYAEKLHDSVLEVAHSPKPVRKALIASMVFVLLLAVLARSRGSLSQAELATLVAAWASFGMVLAQGILALPAHLFINPGRYAAVCGFVILSECVVRRAFQLRPPVPA